MGIRSWICIALVALVVADVVRTATTNIDDLKNHINSIEVKEKEFKKKDAEQDKVTTAAPEIIKEDEEETKPTASTTIIEPKKPIVAKLSTKKVDTTKSSSPAAKTNEIHKNKLGASDDDNYYDYSEYYDDDDDKTTKAADKVTVESNGKKIAIAPVTKSTDKDVKLRPIEKTKVAANAARANAVNNKTTDEDSETDDDDDDEEYENLDDIEALKCPRDCTCERNLNNYLVATCSRLDSDIQKFTTDITDLEVINISPKYPLVLGAAFFKNIGLEHVSSIKIVNATIESIHQAAFEGLNDLYAVNLTNTHIDMIHPDTFASNGKLRILTLAGNNLHAMQRPVSPFIDYMLKAPSVEELDLSNCDLKQLLLTAFNKLDNIVFINLANNALKSLPAGLFDEVETIEELDLSHNNISSLPDSLFNRTALGILNLSFNRFKGKIDFGTPDIQALDLSYNKIEAIPNTLFKRFEGLTNLELRNNSIRKIHQAAFTPLKKLRNIDLSFNYLEQISSSVFIANRELDVIRLNDNTGLKKLPLDGFESEIGTFDVRSFDVSNCDLTDIGEKTFSTMPKITKLNLAWNNIVTLGKGVFSVLSRLADLDLSNNVITEMDDLVFRNNRNLKKISLAGNQIEQISPRLFLGTKDLYALDLSNCELNDLWAEPMPRTNILRNLKFLNVSYNKIADIRQSDLASLESLSILDLTSNEMRCNTEFKNFLKWLQKRNIKSGSAGGLNAEMKHEFTENVKTTNSWSELESTVCMKKVVTSTTTADSVGDSKDINESEIVDDISDDDDEYDDEDDDDEDDDNTEVVTNDSLIAQELDVIKGLNERILDLEEDVMEGRHSINFGSYHYLAPILITIISVLLVMVLVVKLITLLMHRRYERYREALLQSKNSIIYQKLSEDIGPTTPKVHRYAPINQV